MKKYNERYKLKAKEYADQTNNRRETSLKEGDAVLIKKTSAQDRQIRYILINNSQFSAGMETT